MSQYIHFTQDQKDRAASVDLEEFLRLRGETLIRSGPEKRLKSDHSVTVRGREWYDHASRQGGGPISFIQTFYGLNYPEAMTLLLGGESGEIVYPAAKEKVPEPPKPFELPPANRDMRRVYAYLLKQRHIDHTVISHFAKERTLYEDAQYHNCVFVGLDENGMARHAHKRSTNSAGKSFRVNVESSDPRYSFHHIGQSEKLYAFEAPIDLLSFLSLYPKNWEQHSYVALCGTGGKPIQWILEQYPRHRQTILCLDNDKAGREAVQRLQAELRDGEHQSGILCPTLKDWNEDLCAPYQEQAETQAMVTGMTMG
nr:DUF3991 and toprim domain-containing protein [uncultured Oscillibacter sp.]